MKKLIQNIFNKIKNFSQERRRAHVQEIADTIVDTLLLEKLDGSLLLATELSVIVRHINSSVLSFLAEKKIETEAVLEDIETALNELK